MLKLAKDLMNTTLVTIREHKSLEDLALMFEEEKVHGVPVVDARGTPIGVVSRSDLVSSMTDETDPKAPSPPESPFHVDLGEAHGVPLANFDPDQTVADIMSTRLVQVGPEDTLGRVAMLMVDEKVHRVLVTEGDRLLGIVSSTDLLSCIPEYESVIREMT